MDSQNALWLRPSLLLSQGRDRRAAASKAELWRVIWTAGGLVWLCIAAVGMLWAWPMAGTIHGDDYYVHSGARLLHHCLLFLLSAAAYRIGIGLGWPDTALGRIRVIVVNVILSLVVIRVAPFALFVSVGLLDEPWKNVMEGMRAWEPLRATTEQWLTLLRFWLPAYVLGLIAIALVITTRRSHRHTVRLAEMSAQLANARMATLSAQLHPHFLFNALNSISGLVGDSPSQAVEMLARLGDFLRVALESTKNPWTSVGAEVDGVDAYLAVQRIRFRDQLRVSLTVEPEVLKAPIPALLLQPLVENAIEHGLSDPDECLEVTVVIRRSQNRLMITVANTRPRMREPLAPVSFGNGLRNVSARLFAAYNGEGTIEIGPDPVGGGTRAELSIPAAIEPTRNAAERQN
jgi:sensor histidine kinase YesM